MLGQWIALHWTALQRTTPRWTQPPPDSPPPELPPPKFFPFLLVLGQCPPQHTFGFSGSSCETLATPHDHPKDSNRAFWRPRDLKTKRNKFRASHPSEPPTLRGATRPIGPSLFWVWTRRIRGPDRSTLDSPPLLLCLLMFLPFLLLLLLFLLLLYLLLLQLILLLCHCLCNCVVCFFAVCAAFFVSSFSLFWRLYCVAAFFRHCFSFFRSSFV